MGVYIKGMEMPKSCFYCPFREKVNPDDYVCMALNKEFEETFSLIVGKRHKDCPLVSVTSHGRLIDADAFAAEMKKRQDACAEWCDDIKNGGGYGTELYYRADSFLGAMYETKLTLDKMPTIILTEEGE